MYPVPTCVKSASAQRAKFYSSQEIAAHIDVERLAGNSDEPKRTKSDLRYLDWLSEKEREEYQRLNPPPQTLEEALQGLSKGGEADPQEADFESEREYFEYLLNRYSRVTLSDPEKQARLEELASERFEKATGVDPEEAETLRKQQIRDSARGLEYASRRITKAFLSRDADGLLQELPRPYRRRLKRLPEPERKRRLQAIFDYLTSDEIAAALRTPQAIYEIAREKAKEAKIRDDAGDLEDPRELLVSHHQRNLRKAAWKAEGYLAAVCQAVGGRKRHARPDFISDRMFWKWTAQMRHSQEILSRMRLVKVSEPLHQIPADEAAKAAEARNLAEQRIFIDATLQRIKTNSHHVCWITVTLPGRYVPFSTNEQARAEPWDMRLGPLEACSEIQARHHRVMALLRQRGVNFYGFWSAQAQKNGVPHRHYVLACPTIEEARQVCRLFRREFVEGLKECYELDDYQNQRGCAAYVVGDSDERFSPPSRPDGLTEDVESLARYVSRYATRFATHGVDFSGEIEPSEDLRHKAHASIYNLRSLTMIGLRKNGGKAAWRVLWNAMMRGEDGTSHRTNAAISLLRKSQKAAENAAELRKEDGEAHQGEIEHWQAIAANQAYKAALAAGVWRDIDLSSAERGWLEEQCGAEGAPITVKEIRVSEAGNERSECVGVIPEQYADDEEEFEDRLIRKSLDQWELLEKEKAKERALDVIGKYVWAAEKVEIVVKRCEEGFITNEEELVRYLNSISDNLTEPSHRPAGGVGGSSHSFTEKPPPI